MQRRFIRADTGVAADLLQLADRHIQGGVVGILQVQKLGDALAQVHVDQALVTANAVRAVHHRVAEVEFGQVLDQRFYIADPFLLFVASPRDNTGGKQLGFCHKIDIALEPAEAGVQSCRGNAQLFITCLKIFQRIKGRRAQAAGPKEIKQAFASAVTFSKQQHALRRVAVWAFRRASGSSAPRTTDISPSF